LHTDPLPLLTSHNITELPVGVVENFRLSGEKARADLRFGNSARATEIWQDVVDGIIRNVSVGYTVNAAEPTGKRGEDTLVTDWTIFEVSIVSAPADNATGIGRSLKSKGQPKMNTREQDFSDNTEERDLSPAGLERKRVSEIVALARNHEAYVDADLVQQAIEQGWKPDRLRRLVLERVTENSRSIGHTGVRPSQGSGSYQDYTRHSGRDFSVIRAINAAATGDWSRAGFEREASQEAARQMGRASSGLIIPFGVFSRSLSVGVPGDGGYLKGTEHLGDEFIEMLRNRARVMRLGARVLNGLRGDVAIPKQSATATGYWVAEDGSVTLSDPAFSSVSLVPKTLGARTQLSRKLLLQGSPDAENLVKDDLVAVLATEIDRAALHGTALNNQPRGIAATVGIGSVVGGADGAAPDYADILDLIAAVAVDNADVGRLAFLTNSKVRSKLSRTDVGVDTGKFVWENAPGLRGDQPGPDGFLGGYQAFLSSNVSSTLTKGQSNGICSAIFYGNWQDLLIGFWGSGIEVAVDQTTHFDTGAIQIRALVDCDIAVRNAESFAAMLDALTT
jgi:HK97 family phage major capsid protein